MLELRSKINFADSVIIDGDDSLKAVVIGFKFLSKDSCEVLISYFREGVIESVWVDDFRLRRV